jgi:hypothetical protein
LIHPQLCTLQYLYILCSTKGYMSVFCHPTSECI